MASKRKTAKGGKKRGSLVGALALLVLLVILGFELVHVYSRVSDARDQQEQLSDQVELRKEQNAQLRSDLERSDDPSFYQELARSELGLAQDDERIFYNVNN